MTYLKPTNPRDINNAHNFPASGWADSQPSVFEQCLPKHTQTHTRTHTCTLISQHSKYEFKCSCTLQSAPLAGKFVVPRSLHHALKNYSSSQTFMCQSSVSQAKKALEGTIAGCECNSFSSFLAVCIAGGWRGAEWAGRRTHGAQKPTASDAGCSGMI